MVCAVLLVRLSSTRATLVALFCTLSEAFDVPVYWPILVVYFFVLFLLTMRRQIQYVGSSQPGHGSSRGTSMLTCVVSCRHMIKYKYVPFDIGRKVRYGGSHR